MFDLGFQELIVIFVIALLVFGPKKLPEVGRSFGRGLAELRNAMRGMKQTLDEEETSLRQHIPDVRRPIDDLVRNVKMAEESIVREVEAAAGAKDGTPSETPVSIEKKEAETERNG